MSGKQSNETERDGPPYPQARRTYLLLGVIHGVLFGGIGVSRGFKEGHPLVGIAAGVVFFLLAFGVFWKLADDHYRGNVPGKPGELVYRGENDE